RCAARVSDRLPPHRLRLRMLFDAIRGARQDRAKKRAAREPSQPLDRYGADSNRDAALLLDSWGDDRRPPAVQSRTLAPLLEPSAQIIGVQLERMTNVLIREYPRVVGRKQPLLGLRE